MKKLLVLIISGCILNILTCKQNEKKIATNKYKIDTIFELGYPSKLKIIQNAKLLKVIVFDEICDTIFDKFGKKKEIIVYNEDNSQQHFQFHKNGKLAASWVQGYINGVSCLIGNERRFNDLGNLIETIHYHHDIPKGKANGHDLHTVITINDFFSNGKLKQTSFKESFYESDWCNCGLWIEFDTNGKRIKKEVFENCFDDSLACMKNQ